MLKPTHLQQSCAIALSAAVMFGATVVSAQQGVRLNGSVLDPLQKALPNANLWIYGAGWQQPLKATTRVDGTYNFQIPAGNPIARIIYDHPDYHVRLVEGLSARPGDRHEINKVLFSKRGPKTFELIVDQILTYDRLRLVAEFETQSPLNQAMNHDHFHELEYALHRRLRSRYGERILNIPHPLRQSWLGHPIGNQHQVDEQRKVVAILTPLQENVINRLMGDLLFRYGYTENPIYEPDVEAVVVFRPLLQDFPAPVVPAQGLAPAPVP